MAYHSNGAYNFEQVYNMPVYLRTFHLRQLEDAKKHEADQIKQSQSKNRPSKR